MPTSAKFAELLLGFAENLPKICRKFAGNILPEDARPGSADSAGCMLEATEELTKTLSLHGMQTRRSMVTLIYFCLTSHSPWCTSRNSERRFSKRSGRWTRTYVHKLGVLVPKMIYFHFIRISAYCTIDIRRFC